MGWLPFIQVDTFLFIQIYWFISPKSLERKRKRDLEMRFFY